MTILPRLVLVAALTAPITAAITIARADDDIDVDRAEIIEVVETTDGSVWKGVIIELVPGTSIKIELSGGSVHVIPWSDIVRIARQKNPRRVEQAPRPVAPPPPRPPTPTAPARPRLPAPFATSGRRLGVGLIAASPTGAWGEQSGSTLSLAPSLQLGFERVYGGLAFSGGAQVTWIYFLQDDGSKDAFWTLETHGYLRATARLSGAAVHAGLSLGLDTNFSYFTSVRQRYLRVGPGVTIEGGLDIPLTPRVALGFAGVVHPGTAAAAAPDQVPSDADPNVSYLGLRIGTTLRF